MNFRLIHFAPEVVPLHGSSKKICRFAILRVPTLKPKAKFNTTQQ